MLRKSLLSLTVLSAGAMYVGEAHAQFSTQTVASNLAQPLFVTAPPGDTSRLFIVEQKRSANVSNRADIRILDLTTNPPSLLATPFLTISGVSTNDEQGLLGLAFHPDYANNRTFFVYYTNPSTQIVRFRAQAGNPNVSEPTGTPILTIAQPFTNHNGGWIGFAPNDTLGHLYIATGDGGSGNDPNGAGQNINSLLGKMLRIDIDGADGIPGNDDDDGVIGNASTNGYTSPSSNPYVGIAGADEILHLGLRNPWRCSFDRQTGELWIGDVGQSSPTGREEINRVPAGVTGLNFGWVCKNGPNCSGVGSCSASCPNAAFVDPVHNYATGLSCTVIGGYVYRGAAIPGIQGRYFFADYCQATVQSFVYNGTNSQSVTQELDAGSSLTSFGEDAAGELYFTMRGSTGASTGSVIKLTPPVPFNDTCGNATLVGNGSHAFTNAGALTNGPDEPSGCGFAGATQMTSDIWYKYVASCTGNAKISLCGANFDTRIAVYAVCPSGSGESLACNDNFCGDDAEVTFPVVQGSLYQVRIGGANAVAGSGTMVISCTVPPPPSCPSDINNDQSVGVPDLLAVIGAWGNCSDCKACPTDINDDCSTGVPDLLSVIGNWGPCAP